jgi:hypothetical protein
LGRVTIQQGTSPGLLDIGWSGITWMWPKRECVVKAWGVFMWVLDSRTSLSGNTMKNNDVSAVPPWAGFLWCARNERWKKGFGGCGVAVRMQAQ